MNTDTHIHLKRNPSRQAGSAKPKELKVSNTPETNKVAVREEGPAQAANSNTMSYEDTE